MHVESQVLPVTCLEDTVGSSGIALLILDLVAMWGWYVNAMYRPLHPRVCVPVPIVQEDVWSPMSGLDEYGEE
jgi:hypothetical protein